MSFEEEGEKNQEKTQDEILCGQEAQLLYWKT